MYWRPVLGQEEGYTVKFGLSPREIPRACAIFFHSSRLESHYGDYHIPNKDSSVAVPAKAVAK